MELFSYILSQFVHCWSINAHWFFKLILFPATLLKLFMVSRSFGMELFASLRYRIMSAANRTSLTISSPICISFISPYALLFWLVIPGLCWIGMGRLDILVSFFTLKERVCFSLLSVMLAICVIYILYNVEVHSFYS
jgi:hypothetical protein